jgi:hypothetical protein
LHTLVRVCLIIGIERRTHAASFSVLFVEIKPRR